jgi:uracil-DNA glycosylase
MARPRFAPRATGDVEKLRRLHARIRACTKCVAAGYLDAAAPVVAGDITDRVMIVGQAPGIVERTTRTPFSGRAGAELRRWLERAGIGEDQLPYRTAITKCFPGKAPTGAGDRRPSPPEIALCAPWLEAELALVRPEIILLVGALAIDRLWAGPRCATSSVGRGAARRSTTHCSSRFRTRAAHHAG